MDPVQGRRILVVEDEPLSAELVRVLLEDLGCDVGLATDGAEAVAQARDEAFALILMDFFLPILSGPEAVAMIRSEAEAAASRFAPIVALTANDSPADHKAGLAAGMDDYLAKPLNRDALRAMLLKWKILDGACKAETAVPLASRTVDGFDPSRVSALREAMAEGDFNAVIAQAVSSLDGHLLVIGEPVGVSDTQRRAFHRVISLARDLGFISLAHRSRELEEALGAGASLDPASREAFVADGREVIARLKALALEM